MGTLATMAKPTSNPKTCAKFPETGPTMPKGQDRSSSAVVRRGLPDMLTPAELERLRRKQSAQIDLAFKAFSKLPATTDTAGGSDTLTPEEIERLRRKQSDAIDYARKVFSKN